MYAESHGWTVEHAVKGHSWGAMLCAKNDSDCRCGTYCRSSVSSTPRSEGNHARAVRRVVDNCIHTKKNILAN